VSDNCIICSKWPQADRWALREMITELSAAGGTGLRRMPANVLARAYQAAQGPDEALAPSW
jgi:hypothetical protein